MNRRSFLNSFALGAAGLLVPTRSFFFLTANPLAPRVALSVGTLAIKQNDVWVVVGRVHDAFILDEVARGPATRLRATVKMILSDYRDLQVGDKLEITGLLRTFERRMP